MIDYDYLQKIKDWMRSQMQEREESEYYQFEWRCSNCGTTQKTNVKKGIRVMDENPKCAYCKCERWQAI